MQDLPPWRNVTPNVRGEITASLWECFSALLFSSAVLPAAFTSIFPALIFVAGLGFTSLLSLRRKRYDTGHLRTAAAFRVFFWLLSVTPLLSATDLRALIATCGFGIMAAAIRIAIYRRTSGQSTLDTAADGQRNLTRRLSEDAAVVGVLGGHVMLLFSVAFLRTSSQSIFEAWWDIIPLLAILGTAGFTLAVRPATDALLAGLEQGADGEPALLKRALIQAEKLPSRLALNNFALWFICTTIGVFYFRMGPTRWAWADALMQVAFGSLFAWGVSFYQRGWHSDTLAPLVRLLRTWAKESEHGTGMSLRRRMLNDFGMPLLFTLTLSLFASIGLYRSLGVGLPLREDFNSISALCASSVILALAVGSVFMRTARQLSEPLVGLARSATAIASGELNQPVPSLSGPRELTALGARLEEMRNALAQTIGDLERERNGLEERVERRTEQLQRTLNELRQAQSALIQSERMTLVGELMANLAHEIYNPLNAIAGCISALDRIGDELREGFEDYQNLVSQLPSEPRGRLPEQESENDIEAALEDLAGIASVVRNATRRSVNIIGSLKSFSSASAKPELYALEDGLRETLTLLRYQTNAKQIQIQESIEKLPLVRCRPSEINQIFMNLLNNAIHEVPTGGSIELRCTSREGWVSIGVLDNGPGVAAEFEQRIYEPFVTTKPRGQGTGLGLSISSEIARRHGGRLTHRNRSSGGAEFTLELPIDNRDSTPTPAAVDSCRAGLESGHG
jgi:two-component system, NtrC family, sensor kinase